MKLCSSLILSIFIVSLAWYVADSSETHRSILRFLFLGNNANIPCLQTVCLTPLERLHLEDVHIRFQWLYQMFPAILVLSVSNTHKKSKKSLKSLAIIGGILIILGSNFNNIFDYFHYILFPQGNWSFPESSLLIQTYPLREWQLAATTILICAGGIFSLQYLYLTKQK